MRKQATKKTIVSLETIRKTNFIFKILHTYLFCV